MDTQAMPSEPVGTRPRLLRMRLALIASAEAEQLLTTPCLGMDVPMPRVPGGPRLAGERKRVVA